PMAVLLVRALVTVPPALLAYLGAAYVTKSETAWWWREMDGGVWARLVLGSGLMAGVAGVFFFFLGLASAGGDRSVSRPIAFSLAPATAVVLGWLMLGEAMTMRKAVAVTLILIGIVMLTGTPHAAGAPPEGGMPAGK